MLPLWSYLVHFLQPFLAPIGFIMAWGMIIALGWTLFSAMRDATNRAKQMHQIPCTNCQFFTNDYRLKCTIKPAIANTEQAIDCSDYSPLW